MGLALDGGQGSSEEKGLKGGKAVGDGSGWLAGKYPRDFYTAGLPAEAWGCWHGLRQVP